MNTTLKLTAADQKRFWGNVDMLADDHWWWVGPTNGVYPAMRGDDGTYIPAARIALQLAGTPLPQGHRVRYLCSELGKQCINPAHLSAYSPRGGPWSYLGNKRPRKPKRTAGPVATIYRDEDGNWTVKPNA
jgi:hypothetical protein